MNAVSPQNIGYASSIHDLRSLRDREYEAFARVTRNLGPAWDRRKSDFPALASALNSNLQLWRTIAADVSDPGNQLPAELRAQLFYLYEFVSYQTRQVLDLVMPPTALIEVNLSVMRGLRGEGNGK